MGNRYEIEEKILDSLFGKQVVSSMYVNDNEPDVFVGGIIISSDSSAIIRFRNGVVIEIEVTENGTIQFEQQKTLQMLGDQEIAQESKVEQLNKMMRRLIENTVTVISQSISQIRTPDAIVTDQEQIAEFMNNCDREVFNRIKDFAIKLREDSELKPLKITCPNCQHGYEQSFTLDMARFFASAS
jgi:pyruvate dehydrogenase complex dehydrogenase (E1) component